jgi:hypothetical protein
MNVSNDAVGYGEQRNKVPIKGGGENEEAGVGDHSSNDLGEGSTVKRGKGKAMMG